MIVLEYSSGVNEVDEWKERLENMCVPHQLVLSSVTEPKLSSEGLTVKGAAAIRNFLDRYEADVAKWNQDRCDMWFLD